MRVLVLGITGMLGSAVFKRLINDERYQAWGTMRSSSGLRYFPEIFHSQLISGIDVQNQDALALAISKVRPDVVINCVGIIKQLSDVNDPLVVLPINAIMPHRLARLCALAGARLVHISTDCVFSGSKGMYTENDLSDAKDLYGKSKYIGELHEVDCAVTLRTSIIGHELESQHSLVDWFLSQSSAVKGYKNAIFSGLPTVELARVIMDYVLPSDMLKGLYHVSSSPIDKFSLLCMIADVYGKEIEIIPDESFVVDRSLDSTRFQEAVGYSPPTWRELVESMYKLR